MPEPFAFLRALTREAEMASGQQIIPIAVSPFRVGRESRAQSLERPSAEASERRGQAPAKPNNELYLLENTRDVFVSREHFSIVKERDEYFLEDRQSALGTWVEGELVGGNRKGGRAALSDGDVLFVGSYRSGFIFKFVVADQ